MNKHCYRLVFNQAKGLLVATSELAVASGKSPAEGGRAGRRTRCPVPQRRFQLGILRPLTWSTLVALGLVTLPAHAQIAPDRSAPSGQRPHVLESANGTPQVNITAANAKGVSRNAYRQFDVNGQGAILNNARTATRTQIGGWVQGNPNLAVGEARVIVNEVNSSNPSRLHGAVEIAGRRAEVVIANPAGIDVDGAGFINAQGVTLTTGQPQFRNNGALDGYRVEGGTVTIHGDGLNAGNADYAAILARAADIQAGVWAEELEVIAGANRISADRQTIEPIDGSGDAPGVAIDVAQLGGMYAGKITLVANEHGVGVNNAGRVAASQQLTVTADGRLENRGTLISEGGLHLTGQDGVDNRGTIRAGAGIDITSQGSIDNRADSTLIAAGDARLSATGSDGTLRNEQGATLAGGVRDDGSLGTSGDLRLTATQRIEANGHNLAAGGVYIEADTVSLRDSRTVARDIDITARDGDIDASGAEMVATEHLTASTTATLRTDGARVQGEQLDIAALDLSNRGGEMIQNGDDALSLELDTLDNHDGRLASNGDLTLRTDTLRNDDGEIAADGSLTLEIAGEIDNREGTLEAGNQLDVTGQGLDNRGGTLDGETITLDTGGQRLNNTDGLIAASQNLTSTSGELDNTRGTLQAGGDATVDTQGHALTNVDNSATGGILANGTLTLTSGDLDNTDGLIGGGTLNVTADAVTNGGGGTLLSESDLTLTADSLDNRSGEFQAQGNMTLDLDQALRNQGGLLRAGGLLDITASRLVNSATRGDDQGVEGQSVDITADEIVNRQGAMRANERLEIDAANHVDNRDGLISSLDTLSLETEELDNQAGTLIANQQLDLTTARLTGDGRVLSLGDLALKLAGDFTLSQGTELKAAGDFHFATTGTLTNRGIFQAAKKLDLTAGEIVNTASGELSGTTTRLNAGQLTNRGLIDGITTRIDATTLDNLGTGRIYGDQLGIQADTLTNDVENGQAAVIAAREQLDIGAQRLTNREEALLFSAGDMTIAGELDAEGNATGQANRIDNNSATIEALGDLRLAAGQLENTNEHLIVESMPTGEVESGRYIESAGNWIHIGRWRGPVEVLRERLGRKIPVEELLRIGEHFAGHYLLRDDIVGEWQLARWNEYAIARTEYNDQVVSSTPGQILAGGRLDLIGDELVNENSRILAGGVLRGDLANLTNIEKKGRRILHEEGRVRTSAPDAGSYVCTSPEGCYHGYYARRIESDWEPYLYEEEVGSVSLGIVAVGGNQNVSGSGTQVGTLQPASVSGSASGAGNATAGVGELETGRDITEVPGIGSDGASSGEPGEVIRTLMPNVNLPSNSLFRVRPKPTANYLVETDPRFTDRRQWMSSDYLLDRLSPDPAVTHKRLGDGFYEQRLIREQVTQLTGQRFFEGYADDQAQYAALMNNAVTFAKEHGLRPGVSLSAEQMAQLTSDIVWLVEQPVTLEDGSTVKVLVPQVYTRLREGDLKGDGTLIAGDSLQLDVAGDLVNSGTLAGRELVDMTAGNLSNLEGRISGNRVDLKTRRDLTNLGGDITANESLSLQTGRDLNLASTSERMAGLYVTDPDGQLLASAGRDLSIRGSGSGADSAGNLQLTAGRDLSLTAAAISAEGSGLLSAGRDLTLNSQALSKGGHAVGQSLELGTQLDVAGNLSLLAGQDLHARAAQVSSGGDLSAFAGRDLSLEAGMSREHSGSWLGSTDTFNSRTRVLGSEFSTEGNLTLSAGDDLRLTASRLQAGQEATLLAGDDIEFRTAQQHDYSLYKMRRSGGLFGGGRTQRDEVSRTRSIGSEVNTGGDLLVASGLDQTYQAARLESGGDIELRSGGTIRFETASDMHTESHERSKSSFAWQSSSGEGFTRETLRQSELVAQGELIIQAAEGLHIDVEEIDRRSVSQAIDAMVAANPDLAWLQEMEERGDIDWRRVKAIHDSWDYEQSGLGGGAALVVAIVAAATGQYYALAALGGTGAGAVAIAASAAAGSLAGTGAVSLINNRGDLGATLDDTFSSDSLRSAAIAAVSAGVTKGVMGDTATAAKLDLSQAGDIARFAGQRATQAAIGAGVRTAIDGGSLSDNLEDSLESAVAHVASGVLFNAVGNYSQGRFDNGSPEKIALHALTGGAVAQAMGGDFKTGALAAGANEALVDYLAELVNNDPELLVAASQVVGIVAAELTEGDVHQGAEIAAQGTQYNYLRHDQLAMASDELAACEGDSSCMADVVERYQAISQEQNEAAYEACSTDLAACQAHSLVAANGEYARYGDDALWNLSTEALPYMQALFDENIGVQNQFGEATISRSLMEGAGLAPEVAAMLAAMPVGYNRKTDPYHPQATRHQLESENGAGNVTSTTVPPAGGKNVALAGQRHPVTGVVYDQRGYPVFDSYSAYDTRLSGNDFQAASYRAQMRMATRDLRTQIQSNPQLKLQFNEQQLQEIQSGSEKIPGYTWHHHQDRGRMQLVDEDVHRRTGHLGGESMSGGQ